jgi:hypothetical protein
MIKFKDVAHLYLGCDVLVKHYHSNDWGGPTRFTPHLFAESFNSGRFTYQPELFKPLLRPLSDMTEEERVWFKDEVLPLGKKHDMAYFQDIRDAANIINRLRNKGFDCDGLIESGEAIDKTKHK